VLKQYLEYLRSVRNLAENTIKSYRKDMSVYRKYLKEQNIKEDSIEINTVRAFISMLSVSGLSSKSINRLISCIRGYYRFKQRYGYCLKNPFQGLKCLKVDKWLPVFLFEQEVIELLNLPLSDFWGVRDKLIYEFLYSTGCRVSELVGLNIFDLNLKDCSVKLGGKGGKERIAYIGKQAFSTLKHYLNLRKYHIKAEDVSNSNALFINNHGKRLTARGVRYIVYKYLDKLNASKNVSPHTFRHSFATHILNRGADIRVVQELLGHASLSSTQVYTHVGVERLKKVYRKAHPHAGMGNQERKGKV